MRKITTIILMVIAFTVSMKADVYIKMEILLKNDIENPDHHSQEETPIIVEMWVGDSYYAVSNDETTSLIDLKKKKKYMLNRETKTYTEETFNLNELESAMTEENINKYKKHIENQIKKIKVRRIKEKKKIGTWWCTGYSITYSDSRETSTTEIWTTDQMPFAENLHGHLKEMLFSERIIHMIQYLEDGLPDTGINGFIIEEITTSRIQDTIFYSAAKVTDIREDFPPVWFHSFREEYKKVKEQ